MLNSKLVVEDSYGEGLACEGAEDDEGLLAKVVKCIVGEPNDDREREQIQTASKSHNSEVVPFFLSLCFGYSFLRFPLTETIEESAKHDKSQDA